MAWLRRRRGDQVELVRDQDVPGNAAVNPLLQAWADVVDVSGVTDQVAADIDHFLKSYRSMPWNARREIGFRLASVVSSQVTPPPSEFINPLDVLAIVQTTRARIRGSASPNAP